MYDLINAFLNTIIAIRKKTGNARICRKYP